MKSLTMSISVQDLLDDILIKDEEAIVISEFHNMIYWPSIAVLILAFFFAFIAIELGAFLGLVGSIMIVHTILKKHFLLLVLTNKRLLMRYGILQTDLVDMPFDRVESVELEQMLPGHIFGYAVVAIMGTGQRLVRIPYVANARQFRRKYNELTLDPVTKVEIAQPKANKAAQQDSETFEIEED